MNCLCTSGLMNDYEMVLISGPILILTCIQTEMTCWAWSLFASSVVRRHDVSPHCDSFLYGSRRVQPTTQDWDSGRSVGELLGSQSTFTRVSIVFIFSAQKSSSFLSTACRSTTKKDGCCIAGFRYVHASCSSSCSFANSFYKTRNYLYSY